MRGQRRFLKPRVAPAEQGALLVEALVVSVVITIALIGTVASIQYATQQRLRASQRNALNAAIDADLAKVQDLATQLTCCTGVCRLGLAGETTNCTPPFPLPCCTDNRRDDQYFFPQTPSEAQNVAALCGSGEGIISDAVLAQFNALAVNADVTAAGGVRQPIVRLNAVQNQPGNQNILQVTYTDTNQVGAPVRVARVVPPMARFCP